ncbi:MAG: hypothetical protein QNJ78_08280 [Gammaproteobacteria bacterium]|nr:hypothetical protein [Gammaproteobacteria bacterium]
MLTFDLTSGRLIEADTDTQERPGDTQLEPFRPAVESRLQLVEAGRAEPVKYPPAVVAAAAGWFQLD